MPENPIDFELPYPDAVLDPSYAPPYYTGQLVHHGGGNYFHPFVSIQKYVTTSGQSLFVINASSTILIDGFSGKLWLGGTGLLTGPQLPSALSETKASVVDAMLSELGVVRNCLIYNYAPQRLPMGSKYFYISNGQTAFAYDDYTSEHNQRFSNRNYFKVSVGLIDAMKNVEESQYGTVSLLDIGIDSLQTSNLSCNYSLLLSQQE